MAIWDDWERIEPHRAQDGEALAAKIDALPPSSGLSIDRAPGGEALSLVYRPPMMRVLKARVTRRALEQGGWLIVLAIVGFGLLQLMPGTSVEGDTGLIFLAMGLGCFLPALGGVFSALRHILKWTAPRRLEIKDDSFWFKEGRTRLGGVRAQRDELRVRIEQSDACAVLSYKKRRVELLPLTPVELKVLRYHLIDGMGVREEGEDVSW
ncbi:hypothetical protein FRC98_14390 [Lujinxingia vulgaris]|uniref:Uncharacterized protein n=1 Tax=Lujinxingia vulgaris TaxID=2600176 RepID=A0A5C6X6D7_9DELT|nr:hypothetical protein [Lujinxingia vulgaris]TXD35859.1 hypothetical protein FRC98_14390 [Lujinxingia vulgaris]